MPTIAQTRTNTKELGEKLLKEAETKRQTATKLSNKADAAQAAVDAAKRKIAKNNENITSLDLELGKIKEEKIKALGNIVWDIMNDPKIGHLVRAMPPRIRMIPAIKEVLKANPWLSPVLDEILKDYQ